MKYYHLNVSEQDLFFWFSPFDGSKTLPEVFDKLYEDKGKLGWQEFMQKSLNDAKPVMISINPKSLPYIINTVSDSLTNHYINIIGSDENTKQIYVSDCYVPTFIPSTYEGWIDFRGISDSDIGNCWCLNPEPFSYLRNNNVCSDIKDYTLVSVIKRLCSFLNKNSDNKKNTGIDNLQNLSKTVRNCIENGNYHKIYKLLAGIRLNIINPLIYLVNLFEYYPNKYGKWIELLNNLITRHWEPINVKLIKFALAHKKMDLDKISEQIDNAVKLEKNALNDLLNWMYETEFNRIIEITKSLAL